MLLGISVVITAAFGPHNTRCLIFGGEYIGKPSGSLSTIMTTEQGTQGPMSASVSAYTDDLSFVEALRCGDEAAFASLLDQYHTALVRLAMIYVSSRAVAEEVAQETWLGVLQGLDRFEGRSSLKTWIFRILTNRAKTRGQREARSAGRGSPQSQGCLARHQTGH